MSSDHIIELKLFRIHHGHREAFGQYMDEVLLRLFQGHGVDFIHHGPSLHDEDSYFIMRAHPSLAERQERLDSFFGSSEWLMSHEEKMLDKIESMNTAVFEADEQLIEVLKQRFASGRAVLAEERK